MDGRVDTEKADVFALPSDGQNIQEFCYNCKQFPLVLGKLFKSRSVNYCIQSIF